MKTWIYWEGPIPAAYKLCIESIKLWNQDTMVVDEKWMYENGAEEIMELSKGIPAGIRSDIIRFWLLKEFGGQWIDADCIALSPLPFRDDLAAGKDFVSWGNTPQTPYVSSAVIASQPNGKLITEALKNCTEIMKKCKDPNDRKQLPYGSTGQGVLRPLYNQYKDTSKLYPRWKIAKVYWQETDKFHQVNNDRNFEGYHCWNPNAFVYHLTNKPISQKWKNATEEQLMTGKTFMNFLFRKAFNHTAPLRARSVVDHLPRFGPLRGAELGVAWGDTSKVLLQQRQQLHLYMVDLWNHPERQVMLPTNMRKQDCDGYPREKLRNMLLGARKNTQFAKSRRTLIQQNTNQDPTSIPDGSLDFVFVDSMHTYESCTQDVLTWLPKIKTGGLLCGHDWGKREPTWGVREAITDINRKLLGNKEIQFGLDTTWFIHGIRE